MLVAGSVFALMLMGLAVDGVLAPSDDEADDSQDTDDGLSGPGEEPVGDPGEGLAQLLFGDEEAEEGSDEDGDIPFEDDSALVAESEEPYAKDGMLDVEEMTTLVDGGDVLYVDEFYSETDRLILEFDGTEDNAPTIEIDFELEEGAAVVLANGLPITLVEDATDLTLDQIDVVMLDGSGDTTDMTNPAEDDEGDGGGLFPYLSGGAVVTEEAEAVPPIGALVSEALPTGDQPDIIQRLDTEPNDDRYDSGVLGATAQMTDASDDVLPLFPGLTEPVDPITDSLGDAPLVGELTQLLDGIAQGIVGDELGSFQDALVARGAIDPAFGEDRADAAVGSPLDDVLSGGAASDALFGDEGDDMIFGGDGNDEMVGDTGHDTMFGGDGTDYLRAGDGNDSVDGDDGRDVMFGGDGNDTLSGGADDDVIQGGSGTDVRMGGAGNDVLDGTFGQNGQDTDASDILIGGEGDDIIKLGAADMAMGGEGADTFISGGYADNAAMISDFDPSEDVIEIIYDPDTNGDPIVTVEDFADGSGANIVLNGDIILSVAGAQGLDPNTIALRATV